MGYLHVPIVKTATATLYDLPGTIPTYSISDLFMGTVNVAFSNPMADKALLKYNMPYQTFHCVTQAIQIGSYTA